MKNRMGVLEDGSRREMTAEEEKRYQQLCQEAEPPQTEIDRLQNQMNDLNIAMAEIYGGAV